MKAVTYQGKQSIAVKNVVDPQIIDSQDVIIKITSTAIITHTLPLQEAAHAYNIFNNEQDHCIKVVLKP